MIIRRANNGLRETLTEGMFAMAFISIDGLGFELLATGCGLASFGIVASFRVGAIVFSVCGKSTNTDFFSLFAIQIAVP